MTALPEGDLVETGVFHGGTTVLMARAIRDALSTRTLWACAVRIQELCRARSAKTSETARSCPATPRPTTTTRVARSPCFAPQKRPRPPGPVPLAARSTVEQALRTERLLRHVRIVPGWFHQTLPPAGLQSISFLRLDGDTYNGTFEALRRLYPLVVPGGIVYADDAGSFLGAALALRDYFGRPVGTPIREAEGFFDAVWWVKNASLRSRMRSARRSRARSRRAAVRLCGWGPALGRGASLGDASGGGDRCRSRSTSRCRSTACPRRPPTPRSSLCSRSRWRNGARSSPARRPHAIRFGRQEFYGAKSGGALAAAGRARAGGVRGRARQPAGQRRRRVAARKLPGEQVRPQEGRCEAPRPERQVGAARDRRDAVRGPL